MRIRTAACFALLLALSPASSRAQALPPAAAPAVTTIQGKFQDLSTRAAISQVQVKLTGVGDTTVLYRATAKEDGSFQIPNVAMRAYWLEATRLGYATLKQLVRVNKAGQDLGVLSLTPESIPIEGVTVRESPAPATQKQDTTEYRASAVKVHRDATAEDLVQKLPGVTMEGGQIKAQGENVQNVLVNGRPFFGSDPAAAMRNLPAEVVDRIQVYDRMSDQAEFSGFDDGQSQKTMNFILRDQKAQFGKVYGGYGDQERYQSGGNFTRVRGASRFTAIGMSNNVNQKNFSHQDLFGSMSGSGGGSGGPRMVMMGGGGMRGGGGSPQFFRMGGGGGQFDPSSFFVGQQNGVSTTHSGGLNFVGEITRKLTFSASVFSNRTDTDNLQTLSRQYVPAQDSLAYYDQRTTTDSRNDNHRVDARFEWTPDSTNSVIFAPRLYFQGTDARNFGDAANTRDDGGDLSTAISDTRDRTDGNNLSGRLTMRHRFARRGRNVSAETNLGHSLRDGESQQYSLQESWSGAAATRDTVDQQTDSRTITNSWSTRIAFTEPIVPGLQMQAIYHPQVTRSDADARARAFEAATGGYTRPDTGLSNSFENRSIVQNAGIATLLTRGPWRLLTNASYQQTRLESEQTFPDTRTLEHTFGRFVPAVTLTGNFANRRNLRLAWSTALNAPSVSQLQNVVNNSNPLSLSVGNPDLRPTYSHSLSLRLSEADPARSKSRFVFLNVTRTEDPIANSTFTAPADTTVNGVFLARGTQLTRPVNLEQESWNANLFGVYSRPIRLMKSILSLNGGGSFNRTPAVNNGVTGIGSTWALRSGVVLSSNISQNLDFTVSYWSTYNISRNTRVSTDTGDYFTHSAGLRLNSVIGPGVVFRQELNHNLQSGVPTQYGQNLVLWNSTIGKKFLKDQRGELRVTATDALAKNRAVNRSITESYIQDTRDRTLGRYVQAVFTYSFR